MNKSHDYSIWKEEIKKSFPTLSEDKSTEICIVGGGIAGLTTAYFLLKNGKKVILLESHTIGAGETGNTSAHLSNALDDRYYNIIKMHGLEKAIIAAESHTTAIKMIEEIIEAENIECDFKRVTGRLFTKNKSSSNEIEREHIAAKECLMNVYLDDNDQFGKSLLFPLQAQFHPIKYIKALAQKIIELGGEIYEDSQVNRVDVDPLQVTVNEKFTVTSKKIVTATDSQFFSPLSMNFKINPQRTYVIGISIPKDFIAENLYWDNAQPYHYVRIQNNDKSHDILIVGGEDHRVGLRPKHNPFEALLKWAQKSFSLDDKATIKYQWSGQICESIDYLAYIGVNPKNKNIFMITGDSGNGLTHGTLGGLLICDLILKKKNPWADVYRLNRLPLRSLKNLIKNLSSSSVGYLKYLMPAFNKRLKHGEGKIIQRGLKKVAAYKDEKGNVSECSAICSHMGAMLSWNSIEKSWDCPAHGSRFDINGKPLNSPAMTNLKCPKLRDKSHE